MGEFFHGAASRIDREKQWLPLVRICALNDNTLFLLHGPRQQNLDLFVSRIWHYLAQECGHHHRPYVVPLRDEFAKPRSAAGWENNLRLGIAGEGHDGGTAAGDDTTELLECYVRSDSRARDLLYHYDAIRRFGDAQHGGETGRRRAEDPQPYMAAWTAQGIVTRCYEFHMTPDSLVESETREPVPIDELARRTQGLPLIIFSRQLDPSARVGEAGWLRELGAWKRRAWLDPDPRRPEELPPPRRQTLLRFERLGLPRFHVSDEGVLLLARWLAGGGDGTTVGVEPPLPALPPRDAAGDPLAEALLKWALAAALRAPDGTSPSRSGRCVGSASTSSWPRLRGLTLYMPTIYTRTVTKGSLER